MLQLLHQILFFRHHRLLFPLKSTLCRHNCRIWLFLQLFHHHNLIPLSILNKIESFRKTIFSFGNFLIFLYFKIFDQFSYSNLTFVRRECRILRNSFPFSALFQPIKAIPSTRSAGNTTVHLNICALQSSAFLSAQTEQSFGPKPF